MADAREQAAAAPDGGDDTVEAKLLFQVDRAELYLVKHPDLNKSRHQFESLLPQPLARSEHSDLLVVATVQVVEYNDPERGPLLLACVGDTQIPMGRDTPVLRMSNLLYVMPAPEDPSFSYGLRLPATSSRTTVDAFERLLRRSVSYQVSETAQQEDPASLPSQDNAYVDASLLAGAAQPPAGAPGSQGVVVAERAVAVPRTESDRAVILARGQAISGTITTGASTAAAGLVAGATWIGSKIRTGAEALRQHIQPAEQPVEVSDTVRSRVQTAKKVGSGMVAVSAALVSAAQAAMESLASNISDAVRDSDMYRHQKAQGGPGPKTQAAMDVGKSALAATATMLAALEKAGVILLKESTGAAVDVARHKYGEQVGAVAQDAADVTTSVGTAAMHMNSMGAARLAQRTTVAVAEDLSANEEERRLRREQVAQAEAQHVQPLVSRATNAARQIEAAHAAGAISDPSSAAAVLAAAVSTGQSSEAQRPA